MSVVMLGVIFLAVGGLLIGFPHQIHRLDILDQGAQDTSGYTHFLRFLGIIIVLLSLLIFYIGLCPHGC